METTRHKMFSFELFMLDGERSGLLEGDEFLDSVEEALFEAFKGEVTPAILGGVPMLYCTVQGASLGQAIDKVANSILSMGLHPSQIRLNLDPNDRLEYA